MSPVILALQIMVNDKIWYGMEKSAIPTSSRISTDAPYRSCILLGCSNGLDPLVPTRIGGL
jgi:hypothetical protein